MSTLTMQEKQNTNNSQENILPEEENHIIAERLSKLEKLRAAGPAYPRREKNEKISSRLEKLPVSFSRRQERWERNGRCVSGTE